MDKNELRPPIQNKRRPGGMENVYVFRSITKVVFTLHNVGSYLGSNVVSIHIDFVFTLPRESTSKVGTIPLTRMLERPGSKAPLPRRQIWAVTPAQHLKDDNLFAVVSYLHKEFSHLCIDPLYKLDVLSC